jgi:hypothetical protein
MRAIRPLRDRVAMWSPSAMTQQDRGAYTPQTDAPLAFDARAPRGARRPLPMALIGSGVVLVVLIAAVVMYYRSGVRTPAAAPVAVGQPVTTVKTAPAAAAKDEDPFSNLDVYAAQNVPATPSAAKPAFVAPPEEPKARPAPGLTVQVDSAPVHAVPARPKPTAVAASTPATPVAPAAKPAAAAPAAAPTAVAAATPAAPAAGPAAVQIGAYSSAALADKGYQEVATAFPTFMGGKSKRVEPLERDGKMLYRTSVSGFASHSSAQAFCAALKASGHVCLVKG